MADDPPTSTKVFAVTKRDLAKGLKIVAGTKIKIVIRKKRFIFSG
jgi:hypothetical protein